MDIHEPDVPTLDDEYYEGEVPIHAHFCWDDEEPAVLASCNDIQMFGTEEEEFMHGASNSE